MKKEPKNISGKHMITKKFNCNKCGFLTISIRLDTDTCLWCEHKI